VDNLELRAYEQRNHLHDTAAELKTKLRAAREKLDLANQARQRFVPVLLGVAAAGLLAGYGVTGMFTER
jgi:hypothetical protein